MIPLVAAVAQSSEAATKYCFDCPTVAEKVAVSLGVSIFVALPGFFVGMGFHRILARVPLVFRLLGVGCCVPILLFALGGSELVADLIREIWFWLGTLLAVVVSSFDGRRVDADRSSKKFADY